MQRLIVEGNDGWALTQLCESNALPWPEGFTKKTIGKFVVPAGGYDKISGLVSAALLEAGLTNIGIVVDADDAGPEARWQAMRIVLEPFFSNNMLDALAPAPEGIVLKEPGRPVVGIWIMPDNAGNGYLEHFLAHLVDSEEQLWQHTDQTVKDLAGRDFCRFKPVRQQKAMLHTWLAWQEEPGRPFGTAMQAGYLNAKVAAVQPFLNWMQQTFRLGS
ncbi:MAG: hypothetical protein KDC61_13950 [Saprospiraceae bacterium]|nr:hypothetical protein [Saprospiraceae bacterium]MCB9354669.1 hypothetical protein [Lewinellaceae bacterium]